VDREGVIATSHHVLEGSAKAIVRVGIRRREKCWISWRRFWLRSADGQDFAAEHIPYPFGDPYKIAEGKRS